MWAFKTAWASAFRHLPGVAGKMSLVHRAFRLTSPVARNGPARFALGRRRLGARSKRDRRSTAVAGHAFATWRTTAKRGWAEAANHADARRPRPRDKPSRAWRPTIRTDLAMVKRGNAGADGHGHDDGFILRSARSFGSEALSFEGAVG